MGGIQEITSKWFERMKKNRKNYGRNRNVKNMRIFVRNPKGNNQKSITITFACSICFSRNFFR